MVILGFLEHISASFSATFWILCFKMCVKKMGAEIAAKMVVLGFLAHTLASFLDTFANVFFDVRELSKKSR